MPPSWIETPDKANAFYFAGGIMPLRDDDPDYPALIIGNYVLGAGALSSRLGDRIRQKEGLSYGVGSSLGASPLDKRATLTLYAIYNPANLDKLSVGIREELLKILNRAPHPPNALTPIGLVVVQQNAREVPEGSLFKIVTDRTPFR